MEISTTTTTDTQAARRYEQLAELAQQSGILRARDLEDHGIPRENLKRLVETGTLAHLGRGLYALADAPVTEYQTLLEAMARAPQGVIALASALRFHGLTTQNPWKVWMLIETGSRIPRSDYPALLAYHAGGDSFQEGIETHEIGGRELRVTSVAKTIADCFKYRSKIGLDVALEALRDCLDERKAAREELRHFGRVCRVENRMNFYLEALTL
jgi:predicted transcriptional regulator of viral defense system